MKPTTTRFIQRATFVAALVLFGVAAEAQPSADGYELRISNAATLSASTVELDVTLQSSNRVAAIAFAIEFDETRLRISSTAEAVVTPNIAIDVPEGFVASTFFIPGASSRVGVTVYDATEPIRAVPDGRIARLRFDTLPNANGFAYVRIASDPPPSAADAGANMLAWNGTAAGGVSVTTRRPHLTFSPSTLRFGAMSSGESSTRLVAITNSGTAPVRVSEIRMSGSAAFTLGEHSGELLLPPDSTRTLLVSFSSEQSGSHEGFIELDVEDPAGSTRFIPLSGEVAPEGTVIFDSRWLVPAAAKIAGADQSTWRTSLTLVNTGERNAHLRLTLLGASKILAEKQLQLLPGMSKSYSDVIGELFELSDVGGFILVESSSPDLVTRSTTGNLRADGEELGQSVPVLRWEELLHTGDTGWLVALSRTASRRSNVSLINPGSKEAILRVELRRNDGSVIGSRDYRLAPSNTVQSIDIFTVLEVTEQSELTAAVSCLSDDCVFFAYASTLGENFSPIFQTAR